MGGDKDYYPRDGRSEVPCIAEKLTVEEELHGFIFEVRFWPTQVNTSSALSDRA
jgi:hypothetical protein